jgi:hypothetical protein
MALGFSSNLQLETFIFLQIFINIFLNLIEILMVKGKVLITNN